MSRLATLSQALPGRSRTQVAHQGQTALSAARTPQKSEHRSSEAGGRRRRRHFARRLWRPDSV
eukprot:9915109-Alexandrium_andersonii.AAC.1